MAPLLDRAEAESSLVLVDGETGAVVARGASEQSPSRPLAHPAMLALRQLSSAPGPGPRYLATGLEAVTGEEPCGMCAMALLHSRIARVFFVRPRRQNGGLQHSLIHAQPGFNHHFDVYRCHRTQNTPR